MPSVRELFTEAVSIHNNALLLASQGRLTEALPLMQTAAEKVPDIKQAAVVHTNYGNMLADCSQPDQAQICYRRAILLNENFTRAYINLAQILHDSGETNSADSFYRDGLEKGGLEPEEEAVARFNYSNLLFDASDLTEAEKQLRKSLALSASSQAHNNLGLILMKLGLDKEASRHFDLATGFGDCTADAFVNAAICSRKSGNVRASTTLLQKALEKDASSPSANHQMGLLLKSSGKAEDAIQHFRQAALVDPDTPVFSVELLLSLVEQGERQELSSLVAGLISIIGKKLSETKDVVQTVSMMYILLLAGRPDRASTIARSSCSTCSKLSSAKVSVWADAIIASCKVSTFSPLRSRAQWLASFVPTAASSGFGGLSALVKPADGATAVEEALERAFGSNTEGTFRIQVLGDDGVEEQCQEFTGASSKLKDVLDITLEGSKFGRFPIWVSLAPERPVLTNDSRRVMLRFPVMLSRSHGCWVYADDAVAVKASSKTEIFVETPESQVSVKPDWSANNIVCRASSLGDDIWDASSMQTAAARCLQAVLDKCVETTYQFAAWGEIDFGSDKGANFRTVLEAEWFLMDVEPCSKDDGKLTLHVQRFAKFPRLSDGESDTWLRGCYEAKQLLSTAANTAAFALEAGAEEMAADDHGWVSIGQDMA